VRPVTLSTTPETIMVRFIIDTDSTYTSTFWFIDDFKVNYGVEVTEVHSYGSVRDTSQNGEYIVLRNIGSSSITLTGWTLANSAETVYTFTGSDIINAAGGTLNVLPDTGKHFTDVGDAVILIDNNGNGVDFIRYGSSSTAPPSNLQWTGATNKPDAPTSYWTWLVRSDVDGTQPIPAVNPELDTDDSSDWYVVDDMTDHIRTVLPAVLPSVIILVCLLSRRKIVMEMGK
jgi:hypothetical protein